jgi:predicted ABC-type transport system involved in lysophospholipase L1 biosynthesis ATPase subunit
MSDATRAPLLRLRDLQKSFHDGERMLEVLQGVNLQVRAGESLAVLGRSGSGKSTLLHLLGLLDRATAGVYEFAGDEVNSLGERRRTRLRNREIGFVFQHFHLLPDLTAAENARLPLRIAGADREATDRVAGLLDRVGLGERLKHLPRRLSGGEQQRVAIVRALANQPRLVLCDEPTGNLDHETAAGVLEILLDLVADTGATLVMVTHDAKIAARTERRLQLADGRLTPLG